MDSIAKTAEAVAPIVVNKVDTVNGLNTYNYDGVPIDIIKFFGVDMMNMPRTDKDQLLAISKWTFEDAETLGDGMRKLRDLEIKLGSPRLDETRSGKLYNWIKFQNQINDLKKRQEAVSGL